MAYLRILKKDGRQYYYIMESIRRGRTVRSKVLEYLGRDPDPKRLKSAMRYWGVKPKDEQRKRR